MLLLVFSVDVMFMFAAPSSMVEMPFGSDVKVGIEELCPVCGDKVSGYHYGLQTCESCKGTYHLLTAHLDTTSGPLTVLAGTIR